MLRALVAALGRMFVFSVRQEGRVYVYNVCLSHLFKSGTDHWEICSADSLLSVSSQLSLSSQEI